MASPPHASDEDDARDVARAQRILKNVMSRVANEKDDDEDNEDEEEEQAPTSCCAVPGSARARARARALRPVAERCVASRARGATPEAEDWERVGLGLVRSGKVAVVVLAGGQGTRLNSERPKGCYNIGLPSRKCLFQLQCERILRLQELAAAEGNAVGQHGAEATPAKPVRVYIMTSPFTHRETVSFFEKNGNFGLENSQIVFFQQQTIPCLTEDGQPIHVTRGADRVLARAPDGNGGIYAALAKAGCIDEMAASGVECVDCFCVDNALVMPAEPRWIGYCYASDAECGAKVARKRDEHERVGVFAQRDGGGGDDGCGISVIEYSEMDAASSSARDEAGELQFKWANLCMQYFSLSFLQRAASILENEGSYHIAKKQITEQVKGIKLEAFIFDVFPHAKRVRLFEVLRDEEFAPVKNAPGSTNDSPDTARDMILRLHENIVREEQTGGISSSYLSLCVRDAVVAL